MEMREAAVVNDLKGKTTSPPTSVTSWKGGSSARAVGTFVPKLTRKAIEKYGFSAAALLTDWSTIVGADLARYTEPKRLKWPRGVEAYAETEAAGRPGATLELRVDGARALDVQYKARQIIERINSYFGYRAVADLRIIQTSFEDIGRAGSTSGPTPRQVVSPKSHTQRPAPDMTHVVDEPLRAALERLHRNLAGR